jgi:hypothetical protein
MTSRKPAEITPITIYPDAVYRTTLSPAIFGLGPDQTRVKIRNRELPQPFRPTPTSRTEVWTGQQIIEHREKMKALAAEEMAAEHKNPTPQPPWLTKAKPPVRKVKLRPPGKAWKLNT